MRVTGRDTNPRRWMLELSVRGGHRYFNDIDNWGRIGVADESGPTPSTTDDGVLYLDPARPVVLDRERAWVPLLTPEGRQRATVANHAEGLAVVATFGLMLDVWYSLDDDETEERIRHALETRAVRERAAWRTFDQARSAS